MRRIDLIATDIDGTILPRGGRVSAATRRAAARCREQGIPFVLVSGRWLGALGDVVAQAGVEDQPVVIANGSAVLAPDGSPLYERFMEPADVARTYEILSRFDAQINSYVPGGLYCLNTRALRRPATMVANYLGVGRLVLDDRDAFEREALGQVYKLEGMTEDAAAMAELRAELARTDALVTHSSPRNVEIMSRGMGKAAALRWLADRLGVDLERCMAFGDNANDMDMLRAVGWPVAVGNAAPELKRAARIVTDTDANDGVAKVIFREVFGEETP